MLESSEAIICFISSVIGGDRIHTLQFNYKREELSSGYCFKVRSMTNSNDSHISVFEELSILHIILSFSMISIALAYVDKCDVYIYSLSSISCLKFALKVLEDSDILCLSRFTISSGGECFLIPFSI